jgi:hypothetical protein
MLTPEAKPLEYAVECGWDPTSPVSPVDSLVESRLQGSHGTLSVTLTPLCRQEP